MRPNEEGSASADTLAEFAAYIRKAEQTVEHNPNPPSFASMLFASLEGEQAAAAKIVASFNGFNWKEWEAKRCEPTEPPPSST